MVESRKIAEFRISRDRLINALAMISNIETKTYIALIRNREGNNEKMGISFNNVLKLGDSGPQFDLSSSYPIFNDEMMCRRYEIEDVKEWPIVYIACMPEFINAISTLPPIITSEKEEALDMVIWSIKDDIKIKSEVVIFGEHHSAVASIIDVSDMTISEEGRIIKASVVKDEEGQITSENIDRDSLVSCI